MNILLLILCLQDFGGEDGLRKPPPPVERPDHQRRSIPPEEVGKILSEQGAALRREYPGRVADLEILIGDGRLRDAGRMLEDLVARYRHLSDLKKRDLEAYEIQKKIHNLDFTCLKLAEKVRRGETSHRGELEKKLSELFDLRESMRAREIGILKRRIAELEGRLDQRQEKKDLIVQKRLRELLGQKDIVEW